MLVAVRVNFVLEVVILAAVGCSVVDPLSDSDVADVYVLAVIILLMKPLCMPLK